MDCQAFVKYVTTNLNLRCGPGTNYSVVAVIPSGTPVEIDEDCDCKWVCVEYNGMIGYISTAYLSSKVVSYHHKTCNYKSTHKPKYQSKSINNTSYNRKYYTNSEGERVQSPTYYSSVPAGATALCRDGTYSFSQSRRGTCSRHGGVARWYR